ncbi:MAG: LysR family transcriptional regulator [Burkholderiales bacterium]|nr:LysR family transcriptional regulator [Burkholderiales bacterium]
MEFRDLSYLLEVASVGHIGRAAERIGLTQPALTKCIARLEGELGVPLLERTPKGVSLTVYGRHLADHAQRARAANLDIKRQITELATGRAGHLRIGTGMILAQHVLPTACTTLLRENPGITLEITSGNTDTLFPALRNRQFDAILASIDPNAEPGICQTFLMEDTVTVITRKDHPLQKQRHLHPRMLAGVQWALPALHTLPSDWLMQRCRTLGINPLPCPLRTGTLPTLLHIVAHTDLLAFQSWSTVRHTNDYGQQLRPLGLESLVWRRNVGIAIRDHGYISPAVNKLIEALQKTAANEQGLHAG